MSYAKVYINVPSGGDWCSGFGISLNMLVGSFAQCALPGIERQRLGFAYTKGSNLIQNRTEGVRFSLEGEATHLLFLDDDMVVPADTLHRMFSHGKQVVVGNYVGKSKVCPPMTKTAHANKLDGSDDVVSLGKTGLEKLDGEPRSGLGCVLVAAEVFYRIDFPWFGHEWKWVGEGKPKTRVKDAKSYPWHNWKHSYEDWWFFKRCADAKIPVYVDHDVSNQLGHVGGAVYRHGGWDNCEAGR